MGNGNRVTALFLAARESAPAGSRLHAVGGEGVPFRAIAEVIGKHLDLPLLSLSPEEAEGHFEWLAHFAASDLPASSTLTGERFNWQPRLPGLLADLDAGHS
ncbi:Rossmann-fold NAD(P)-binding domain-containing protein [Nocardia aurantiaca]|uniref:hypothetical protein n=1 Tax=Nocardia aurantiaca TaxID=2675850 RepID=UPI002E230A77